MYDLINFPLLDSSSIGYMGACFSLLDSSCQQSAVALCGVAKLIALPDRTL